MKTLATDKVIDQTFPVMMDNVAIMIPYPKRANSFSLNMSTSTIIVNNECKFIFIVLEKNV